MPKLEGKKTVPVEQHVFAKNFKLARLVYGKTQEQIQELTQLSRSYLSNFECGSIGIGLDTMALLAQAVKIPLYYLLDPKFQETFDFESSEIWEQYREHLDNSSGILYERRLFAKNFKAARIAAGFTKKTIEELTGTSSKFLVVVERAESGMGIDNAVKLAHTVMVPLKKLLTP